MVQRKVQNKLGILANSLNSEKLNKANTKPSLQINHDGKSKGSAELKAKRMKKSRSIKRVDLENTLPSSARSHEPPGKPAPYDSPAKTPSHQKPASSLGNKSSYASPGSPNYMKSTSSFEAKKEQSKVSISSSSKLHKATKYLNKTASLKKVRTLTKAPTFKHTRTGGNKCSKVILCDNLDVKRATCSTTLKDSKFPPYLMLKPGATEANGTSVMKVCPYNYCSLNGHYHEPAPPLKRFLSSRRLALKTQKVAKSTAVSPGKAKPSAKDAKEVVSEMPVVSSDSKEGFFVEIYVPEREFAVENNNEMKGYDSFDEPCTEISYEDDLFGSEDSYSSGKNIGPEENHDEEGSQTPGVDKMSEFSYDGSGEVDTSATVSLDEFFGGLSDMEWEEGQISVGNLETEVEITFGSEDKNDKLEPGSELDSNAIGYIEKFLAENFLSAYHEEISEYQYSSDADTFPDSESPQTGEEITELFVTKDAEEVNKEAFPAASNTTAIDNPDEHLYEPLQHITEAGDSNLGSYQDPSLRDDAEASDNYREGQFDEEPSIATLIVEDESTHNTEGMSMETEDLEGAEQGDDKKGSPTIFTDTFLRNFEEQNDFSVVNLKPYENCVEAIEGPEMEDTDKIEDQELLPAASTDASQIKGSAFTRRRTDLSQELHDNCNKIKISIRRKKVQENSESDREFNPREPNFLPLEPEPEAEKVDLRHQEMEERKNAEEWMLDYALQRTVGQLAPARKRKVALLVEAFEAVTPMAKFEPHLRKISSGFAHPGPIQASS